MLIVFVLVISPIIIITQKILLLSTVIILNFNFDRIEFDLIIWLTDAIRLQSSITHKLNQLKLIYRGLLVYIPVLIIIIVNSNENSSQLIQLIVIYY